MVFTIEVGRGRGPAWVSIPSISWWRSRLSTASPTVMLEDGRQTPRVHHHTDDLSADLVGCAGKLLSQFLMTTRAPRRCWQS